MDLVALRLPNNALLGGRTLAESGLALSARLMVIALTRAGRTKALPPDKTVLHAGDMLLTHGRLDRFGRLRQWSTLVVERELPTLHEQRWSKAALVSLVLPAASPLVDQPLRHQNFRETQSPITLAVQRGHQVFRTRLSDMSPGVGDTLLVRCRQETLEALKKNPCFASVSRISEEGRREVWLLNERLFVLRVLQESPLVNNTVGETSISKGRLEMIEAMPQSHAH